MKKGKVFGKSQIVVAVMLLALGGAIWLNMKYTPSSGKYLGEASYVSGKTAFQRWKPRLRRKNYGRLFHRCEKGTRKQPQKGAGKH